MRLTWEEIKKSPKGAILHDEFDEGLRFIVMRGPSTLCAYVGVPEGHPLAGFNYAALPSVDAHGGLTFSKMGGGGWPAGYYWYGWDYGHSGDYPFYYDEHPSLAPTGGKKWLVEDVLEDKRATLYDFKHLMRLAEQIHEKAQEDK